MLLRRPLLTARDPAGTEQVSQRKTASGRRVPEQTGVVEPRRRRDRGDFAESTAHELGLEEPIDLGRRGSHSPPIVKLDTFKKRD